MAFNNGVIHLYKNTHSQKLLTFYIFFLKIKTYITHNIHYFNVKYFSEHLRYIKIDI